MVTRTLKGHAQADLLVLNTPASDASCGVGMLVAAEYVIFRKENHNGIIACNGSGVLDRFGIIGNLGENDIKAAVRAELKRHPHKR